MAKSPRPPRPWSATRRALDPESKRFVDWLAAGLAQPGKSLSGLARALNRAPPQARKLLDGDRRIQASELHVISRYIDMPVPPMGVPPKHNGKGEEAVPPQMADVVCEAGNKHWFEHSVFGANNVGAHAPVPTAPDPRYAGLTQYAALITDTTMDRLIEKGAYAIFVPYKSVRRAPVDGDIVAVEIRRANLFKPSVLRMVKASGGWELQTFARKDNATVIRFEKNLREGKDYAQEEVDIRGLVIAKYAVLALE